MWADGSAMKFRARITAGKERRRPRMRITTLAAAELAWTLYLLDKAQRQIELAGACGVSAEGAAIHSPLPGSDYL